MRSVSRQWKTLHRLQNKTNMTVVKVNLAVMQFVIYISKGCWKNVGLATGFQLQMGEGHWQNPFLTDAMGNHYADGLGPKFWVITFILWCNISILMGVVSSSKAMWQGVTEWFEVTFTVTRSPYLWTNMLDNALHHHHQNTKWKYLLNEYAPRGIRSHFIFHTHTWKMEKTPTRKRAHTQCQCFLGLFSAEHDTV